MYWHKMFCFTWTTTEISNYYVYEAPLNITNYATDKVVLHEEDMVQKKNKYKTKQKHLKHKTQTKNKQLKMPSSDIDTH